MKISIITSVYNTESYLKECLDSLLNQTNQDFELIIINDGSKDDSLKIIKNYENKIKNMIIIDKKNTGVADSRNKGLERATGDYMMFLDSDDYLETDAIEKIIYNIKENIADIYMYETRHFNKSSTEEDVHKKIFDSLPNYVSLKNHPILCKVIRSTPIVYSKKIYDEVRFIPNTVHEDNYYCLKAYSMAEKIFVARRVIYNARTREDKTSIMQNLNYQTFLDLYQNILTADLEIKNKKIIKYHMNQLYVYSKTKIDISLYKLQSEKLINKYLKEMRKNKIINSYNYIYLLAYKKIKHMKDMMIKIKK